LVEQRRGFLETERGFLSVIEFLPAERPTGSVLFVPPFGEEMNHCRRVVAEAGRRLARRGFHTVAVDLSGTGESSDQLIDVDLQRWMGDLETTCGALTQEPHPLCALVGIRFGALLAAALVSRLALDAHLVLWQPVLRGADHLREMAAQRAVADRLRGDADAPTASDVMQWLQSGRNVELGGYQISPQLGRGLFHLELATPATPAGVHWIDVQRAADPTQPAGQRAASHPGTAIPADWAEHVTRVCGPPFWSQPGCPLPAGVFDATEDILSA
jgi:exosortase A-associated hydrolase 2